MLHSLCVLFKIEIKNELAVLCLATLVLQVESKSGCTAGNSNGGTAPREPHNPYP